MATSVRELSFQMVIDSILKPAGVKVGGFPEEMFLDLSADEQEKWSCNICFLVVKDCHECKNKHLFCHSCIVAWSMTSGQNSQCCPYCRCEQTVYASNKAVDRLIEDKRVTCPNENCPFTSPLKIFLLHNHGRMEFSNANIDLEGLRSRHRDSPFMMSEDGLPSFARMQRLQGRVVAQQIRLLLHLEFWLRHQALIRITRPGQGSRVEGLDEVILLSEQLNEVGSVLSAVFESDLDGMLAAPRRLPSVGGRGAGGVNAATAASSGGRTDPVRHPEPEATLSDDDDTDLSSLSSNESMSDARRDFVRQLESSAATTASYAIHSNYGPPPHRVSAAASLTATTTSTSTSTPRLPGPATSPSSRALTHRLLDRTHDTSRSLVARESDAATPSTVVAQQPEHVATSHVTEHVTLPPLTGNVGVVAPVAVRDRAGVTPSAVVPAVAAVTAAPSPPGTPVSTGSALSLLDTSTAPSSQSSRETTPVSVATRQSSETAARRATNLTSRPAVATTTPRTSLGTTGATPRQTAQPASVAATRQSSQPASDATTRRASKPVAGGAVKRRTSQTSNGATTRQLSQPPTVALPRRTSQQTPARVLAPPRGSIAASRPARQPSASLGTRRTSQPTSTRQPAPPRGPVPASRTEAPARQLAQRRLQSRSNVASSQAGAPIPNVRLPTTPGQLMRARRRSEISQEIADSLRKTHDNS